MTSGPFALRHDRSFRSFWAGQTVSQFGDRITDLAVPLIAVVTFHASAWQVSWLTALVWLPTLAGAWLGVWIDRRGAQRALMVSADLLRAVVLLTVPVAHALGVITIGQLYVVVLLAGLGRLLFDTAYPAFFVQLVPRQSYVAANSALSLSRSASNVGGPALAGVLVQAFTAPVAVLLDAVSFVVSAVLLRRVPAAARQADDATSHARAGARAGVAIVLSDPELRAGLAASTTINTFTFLTASGLTVLFATRDLGLHPATIGIAFGVGSIGALVGAAIAPGVSRAIGVGPSVAIGSVVFPAPLALLAIATGPMWARVAILAGAEFIAGLGVMLFDVNLNSLNASLVPDGVRARVAGAYSSINYGVRPIAAVVGGAVASTVGLRASLLIAAGGGSCSVIWLLRSPVIRRRGLPQAAAPIGRSPVAQPVPDAQRGTGNEQQQDTEGGAPGQHTERAGQHSDPEDHEADRPHGTTGR